MVLLAPTSVYPPSQQRLNGKAYQRVLLDNQNFPPDLMSIAEDDTVRQMTQIGRV